MKKHEKYFEISKILITLAGFLFLASGVFFSSLNNNFNTFEKLNIEITLQNLSFGESYLDKMNNLNSKHFTMAARYNSAALILSIISIGFLIWGFIEKK